MNRKRNDGVREALNNLPAFEWENQPQLLQLAARNSGEHWQVVQA